MVYMVGQTKGGCGKSTVSNNILPILIGGNLEDTKIVEIDNHNNTCELYKNSILANNMKTIKVSSADDTLDEIFFDALANKSNIIIDAGGGDDTDTLLKLLKNQPKGNIKYIIPFSMGDDDFNVLKTLEKIDDLENCLVILNGYTDKEKIKEQFLYFFGDDDVLGLQQKVKKVKYTMIPFSTIFTKAKLNFGMTIWDLAEKSKCFNSPTEASEKFLEESGGDAATYKRLYRIYKNSLLAVQLIKEIEKNLKEIR